MRYRGGLHFFAARAGYPTPTLERGWLRIGPPALHFVGLGAPLRVSGSTNIPALTRRIGRRGIYAVEGGCMADRTAAGIFGDVFGILAKRKNREEASAIATEVFALMRGYDFSYDQIGADTELVKLGLAREVPDPDYAGETVIEYGPVDSNQ